MTSPINDLQSVHGDLVYETRKSRTIAQTLNLDTPSKFLMVTKKGNYFLQFDCTHDDERNQIRPLTMKQAIRAFNVLEEKVQVKQAFPTLSTRPA